MRCHLSKTALSLRWHRCRFSKSRNERIASPKKLYIGDVGIKNLVTGFRDLGASYENLVFLKIKNNSPSYYLKDLIEIDFIFKDTLIEAKYGLNLNEKQRKLFEKVKIKNKVVAKGVDCFLWVHTPQLAAIGFLISFTPSSENKKQYHRQYQTAHQMILAHTPGRSHYSYSSCSC